MKALEEAPSKAYVYSLSMKNRTLLVISQIAAKLITMTVTKRLLGLVLLQQVHFFYCENRRPLLCESIYRCVTVWCLKSGPSTHCYERLPVDSLKDSVLPSDVV